MEAPKSICREIASYLDEQGRNAWEIYPRRSASLNLSRECGCRYCYVACHSLGEVGYLEENKAINREAVVTNSKLSFGQPGDGDSKKDKTVSAEFRGSGLVFKEGGIFDKDGDLREVFVRDRADDPTIPVSASISGYTGSDESFGTVSKWFETCLKEHKTLCPSVVTAKGKPLLPCRVIDVELYASQDVRLVETEGGRGHYACLSHCWGGEQPLQTTLDTLTQHRKEIKWELLPRTFQDAITVTRKFGIQYIWIDSLCIIQDSTKDWREQSALMAEIYQSAIITIAGSASSGPRQGLFRTADPAHIDQPFSAAENLEGVDEVRSRIPLSHNAFELPLLHRGWVFQERLLSPRYLHFGQNELIWECMEHLTCECGCLSLKDPYRHKWLEPKNRLHPDSLQLLKRSPPALPAAWRATVVDYSRMKLSYEKDIFPAVSGIAKIVKEATGWEYVAGLWKETLLTDLVWRTEKPQTAARCEIWRAPTFSWASVVDDGKGGERDRSHVSYAFMDILSKGMGKSNQNSRTDFYATVVETKCEAAGNDVTGQLRSGFVILRGTLIRAELYHTPACAMGQWQIGPTGTGPLANSFFHPDFNFSRKEYGIQGGNAVYCLKLIGNTQSRDTGNGEYLIYLVLRLIEGSELPGSTRVDTFERIALLRDARGPEEVRLADGSEESAIKRDLLVKIV